MRDIEQRLAVAEAFEPGVGHAFSSACACAGCAAKSAVDQRADTGGPDQLTIPGDISTSASIAIGSSVVGQLETVGDHDWYRVNLVAGQSYAFTLDGSGGSPVTDLYLELFNASGSLIALDDDAGPGLNSLMRFTATSTGTYYLNARAFASADQPATTGQYTLAAAIGPPQDPLDTIDLGFAVSGTALTVYFALANETFDGLASSRSWTGNEISRAMEAFGTFAAVTPLTFTQVGSASGANFIMSIASLDSGVLGQASRSGGVGYLAFSPSTSAWQNLAPGGLGFTTLIHEMGHGLGLAHPHDNSGNSEVMQGVIDSFDSYGTFGLNQGVYTTMTYNDGWPSNGQSGTNAIGNQATPMALDVALLQQKYGVNAAANAGSSVYVLPTSVRAFTSIWDAGGVDTIYTTSAIGSTIDLRPASLLNAAGGGGYVSANQGFHGGFTIAAGVVIENATGADGGDRITGNAAANSLLGYGGNDTISGGDGADIVAGQHGDDSLSGDAGDDRFWGGDGRDTLYGGAGADELLGEGDDDRLFGGDGDDIVAGQHGDDELHGDGGNDRFWGGDGADTLYGDAGDDELLGEGNNDSLHGGDGADAVDGHPDDDYILGEGHNDTLFGGDGADVVAGQHGDDVHYGGAGYDRFWGGDGADVIYGEADVDELLGEGDNDTLFGGDGADIIAGQHGDDTHHGGDGDDRFWGGDGNDVFYGDAGADFILGEEGDDLLFGGADADVLAGQGGADQLRGEAGADRLYGGGGADFFIFETGGGADIVHDFEDGLDLLDLRAYAGASFANTTIAASGASDTLVTFAFGETALLVGINVANVTSADFLFA